MKNLNEYIGQELEIVNTNFFKSNYDFKVGDTIIYSLRSLSNWGNKYEVNGANKTWEFFKQSVWSNNLLIKEKGTDSIIAEIKGSVFKSNSIINLPRGEKLNVVMNVWKSTFELQNEFGTALVSFKNKKWYSSNLIVTIQTKSEVLDKYPFVIMLAFLMVLQKRHSAAA